MMNRKDDIINFLGRTLFMVLFFILISAFSQNSFEQDDRSVHYEWISIPNTSTMSAVSVEAIQLPLFDKSWVSVIDKSNFTFFNEDLKISAYNKKISQRIISFQKTQPLIKTTILCGFYHHLFPVDNDELPVLS